MKSISFLGGVDPDSRLVVEVGHDLKGKNVKDAILCFPHDHDSTVGSYVVYSFVKGGVGPKAIINETADPVVVVGAIIAEMSMVDQIYIQQIKTGDDVAVDGSKGIVKVARKEQ